MCSPRGIAVPESPRIKATPVREPARPCGVSVPGLGRLCLSPGFPHAGPASWSQSPALRVLHHLFINCDRFSSSQNMPRSAVGWPPPFLPCARPSLVWTRLSRFRVPSGPTVGWIVQGHIPLIFRGLCSLTADYVLTFYPFHFCP